MVGAGQLGQLKRRWAEYRFVTDPGNGPIDPVEALHLTGALLHAVGDVIASEESRGRASFHEADNSDLRSG